MDNPAPTRNIRVATLKIRQIPEGQYRTVYGHKVTHVVGVSVPMVFKPLYRVDVWGNTLLNEVQAAYACLYRTKGDKV